MIIKTPLFWAYALIDFLLTLLAWLAFSYLFVTGLIAILVGEAGGRAMPLASRLLPAMHTLMVYMIVAACIAVILFSWAQYNTIRFSRYNRRRMYPVLAPEVLANSFGMTVSQIGTLRASRRAVIHHTDGGLIHAIDVDNSAITRSSIQMIG